VRRTATRTATAVTLATASVVVAATLVVRSDQPEIAAHPRPGTVLSAYHRGDPNNAIVAVRGGPPLVALSFDDGPLPGSTDRILRFLRRQRIHATFFVIGRRVARHPELARAELAAGHELGSHTWSHPLLPALAPDASRAQILGGARALRNATGRRSRLFRPPHGFFDRRVGATVAAAGMQIIGWDVAIDRVAHGRSTRAAARLLIGQIHAGSIVLAHDTARGARRATELLTLILPQLRRRGLRFVTVSALLRASAAQPSAIASSSPPSVPTSSVPSAASAG